MALRGEIGSGWDEIGNPNGDVLSFISPGLVELGKRCLRVEAAAGTALPMP
jgi:hypothetical protein